MQNKNNPDIDTLRRIRSLSQFDDTQLQKLAANLKIETADKGSCLIELGSSEKSSLYLIDGVLRGITHDHKETRFASTNDGELHPIAAIRPSKYRIVADEPVRYFKLVSGQLSEFARLEIEGESDANNDWKLIDEPVEQTGFKVELFKDLLSGDLKLPSLPDVAQRIQKAFVDDLVTPETVGVIIQSDPVMTAKIIMVANSPLYGGRVQIGNLQQAVVRVGLETTRKLVMAYALRELFSSKNPFIKKQMQAVWKHSMYVASLSRLLAEHLGGFNVERAQLAGLVHDIGEVAILNYAQQYAELQDEPDKLLEAVKSMRPQVTGMLLEKWNFSPEFISVGQQCEDWFRNPDNQADLCDLVLIAQYHAMIGTPQQRSLPPVKALPAFAKLGMDELAVEDIIEFLNKSRDKIKLIEENLRSL